MWRRALVAFLGSMLGSAVGVGLLYALLRYVYKDVGEGLKTNIIVCAHIFAALALAAGIWGSIIAGIKMGVRSALVCLGALILSAPVGFCGLMLALQFYPQPDLFVLWPITTVVAVVSGAVGGAFVGWGLGGKRLLRRSAVIGALSTGLVFGVPLTPALLIFTQSAGLILLFIPFVIFATYLGTAMRPRAASSGTTAPVDSAAVPSGLPSVPPSPS